MKTPGKKTRSAAAMDPEEGVHLAPLLMLQNVINQDFERFLTRFGSSAALPLQMPFGGFSPALDVWQQEHVVHVEAELSGVEAQDIEITLVDSILTIQGERKRTDQKQDSTMFRREIGYGTFRRSVSLPGNVDAASAQASLKNGMLAIALQVTGKRPTATMRIAIATP